MRPKALLIILIVFCCTCLLLWLRRQVPPSDSPQPDANTAGQQRTPDNTPFPASPSLARESGKRPGQLAEISSQHPEDIRAWKQEAVRPIQFYGRVLDQNDQPIENAVATFTCNDYTHHEGSINTNTSTDKEGFFSLSGLRGSTLGVSVQKPGYHPLKSTDQTTFSYITLPGYDPFQPDPSAPVLFHLRKRGTGSTLVTSQHGDSPEVVITGLRDGSPQRLDLYTQKVGVSGQIEFSAVKPAQGETAPWSFHMGIPDGGFVEENDQFPFEAPETGYRPTVQFQFSPADPNWTENLHKRYYIVFGQPAKYGHIEVTTGAHMGVRLRYSVNPTGARDLEPSNTSPASREMPPGVSELIPDYPK